MKRDTYDDFREPARTWGLFADQVDWSGRSVLDVGCHAGWFLFAARRAGASRLIGVDLNGFHTPLATGAEGYERPFDRIRREGGEDFELIEGDWLRLPFIPHADVALCLNALHYMSSPERAQDRIFSAAGSVVVLETSLRTRPGADWRLEYRASSHWNGRTLWLYRRNR